VESKFSASADRAQYYPEIIVLGDGVMDGFLATLYQENRVWQNAVTVGYQPYELDKEQQACFLAYKDADPQAPVRDIRRRACQTYNNLRQLFIGIQVAGPRLGPTSIDRGYHAIPKISSSDPTIPACFYNTDDYTCIKDMVVQYWDPNGQAPNSTEPGCYRMAEDGKRYIVGQYPDGEATSYFRRGQDVCNGFDGSALRSVSP
jgi:hypothetical protein